jgi:hypothetical protein
MLKLYNRVDHARHKTVWAARAAGPKVRWLDRRPLKGTVMMCRLMECRFKGNSSPGSLFVLARMHFVTRMVNRRAGKMDTE